MDRIENREADEVRAAHSVSDGIMDELSPVPENNRQINLVLNDRNEEEDEIDLGRVFHNIVTGREK